MYILSGVSCAIVCLNKNWIVVNKVFKDSVMMTLLKHPERIDPCVHWHYANHPFFSIFDKNSFLQESSWSGRCPKLYIENRDFFTSLASRLSPLQQTDRLVRYLIYSPLHPWCNVCLMISRKILIPWSCTVATHCPRFIERVIIYSCIVIGGGYISPPVLSLLEVQLALFAYYR